MKHEIILAVDTQEADKYSFEWNDDVNGFIVTNKATYFDANLQFDGDDWGYGVDGGFVSHGFTDDDKENSLAEFNDHGIGEKLKAIFENSVMKEEFENGGSFNDVYNHHQERLELASNATFDAKVSYYEECINECDFYDDDEDHSDQLRYAAAMAYDKYGLNVFSHENQEAWQAAINKTVRSA